MHIQKYVADVIAVVAGMPQPLYRACYLVAESYLLHGRECTNNLDLTFFLCNEALPECLRRVAVH